MPKDLDRLDAEHIEETQLTPGYSLIRDRTKDEIARKIRGLIDSGEAPDLTRGMILGLELALRIPGIMKAECKGGPEKHGR